MVFFKDYKKTDFFLAIFSSIIIISTFMILKPADGNGDITAISSNVVKDSGNYVLGFSVIIAAIIIIIAGFILGKHHHKKEQQKESKEIIPKDKTLPVFDIPKTDTIIKAPVIDQPKIAEPVNEEKPIVAEEFMNKYVPKIEINLPTMQEPVNNEKQIAAESDIIGNTSKELQKIEEAKPVTTNKVDEIKSAAISTNNVEESKPITTTKVEEAKPFISRYDIETPYDKQFFLSNGQHIKNIRELQQKIDTIPEDIFYKHVGNDYNHFADWIEGVFNEKPLAEKLRHSKTKQDFAKALSV